MNSINGVKTYKSRSDYIQNAKQAKSLASKSLASKSVSSSVTKDTVKLNNKIPKNEDVGSKIKNKVNEVKDAGTSLIKDAGNLVKKAITTPGAITGLSNLLQTGRPEEVNSLMKESINSKDALIFFVSGLRLNPFDDGAGGLPDMAKYFDSSSDLRWNDSDRILEKIKLERDKPVVLVGHGMGSDSIVDIANKLNTAEFGFRKVNLLVTLDSVGFENDIIPPNVLKNKNVISDQDFLFNDGPNVARDNKKTNIENVLTDQAHNDIEYSADIQMDIFEDIQNVLFEAKIKNEAKLLSQKVGENLSNTAQVNHQLPIL